MFEKYLFGIVALISGGALAQQTEEQKTKYADWSDVMDQYGYSWEPFEVTTEDGYILTTFHITGKQGEDP